MHTSVAAMNPMPPTILKDASWIFSTLLSEMPLIPLSSFFVA